MATQEPGQWTGALFAERYRVGRQLDRGGMGAVYEGVRVDTGVRVAIKVLHPHLGEDRYHLTRFQREAEAAAMLGHPHIVRVLDFRAADNEPAYLVMEFLEGNSLSRIVKESGPLEQRRVVTLGTQVLSALSAAHAAGIVHRDIKPSNIFLAAEGGRDVAKLVDFGIAKMMEGTGYTRMTATGALVGTPAYMPPEQALGKEVDGRADIYSLGASLFVALTARPPFTAPAFSELIMKILRDPAPSIAQFRPDIDPRLDAVIAQSLSKKPEERFQSADAMAHALSPWVSSEAMPTVALRVASPPPDTSDDFDSARTSQLPATSERRAPAQIAPVAVVVEPVAAVRGATLATNEARSPSAPSLPARPAAVPTSAVPPSTVPVGASIAVAAGGASRPASSGSGQTRSVPEAGRRPSTGRSPGVWLLVGGVVVVAGLAVGAVGAVLLSHGASPARVVGTAPGAVRPVPSVPSTQLAKTDPRKPPRDVADPIVVALALPVADPAPVADSRAGERVDAPVRDDDPRSPRRPPRATAADPEPTRLDDGTLTRVPDSTSPSVVASPPPQPEPAAQSPAQLTVEVRAETFGLPPPLPGMVRSLEHRLVICRSAVAASHGATASWTVNVDSMGRVQSVRAAAGVWPNITSCVEPHIRGTTFPPSSRDATYSVTMRVR